MRKACMVVGDRIWTLTYTNNIDGTLEIQNFENEDQDGYMFFETLEKLDAVHEAEGRIVEAVTINGTRYEIRNQQNVYTYRRPL